MVNQTIIEAINENLGQKGLELERSNPDLLVLVTMRTESETRTTINPLFAAYPYGSVRSVHPIYHPFIIPGLATGMTHLLSMVMMPMLMIIRKGP